MDGGNCAAELCGISIPASRGADVMALDLVLGAITALGILLYLVAALVRPERF